jgi:hypothetical protein
MKRIKQAIRTKEKKEKERTKKAEGITKAKGKPKFGDFRYDFVKSCKHDLQCPPERCLLCMLARMETDTFFEEEKANVEKEKEMTVARTAEMRYEILDYISRTQAAGWATRVQAQSLAGQHVFELSFSEGALESLIERSEELGSSSSSSSSSGGGGGRIEREQRSRQQREQEDEEGDILQGVAQLARLRMRLVLVGAMAATLIQSRVRGRLTRRRVKRHMLQRFVFEYPNKYSPPFSSAFSLFFFYGPVSSSHFHSIPPHINNPI